MTVQIGGPTTAATPEQLAALADAIGGGMAAVAWAARPDAAANTGKRIIVTDLSYSMFYSDGANWLPQGGSVLLFNRGGSIAAPVASIVSSGAALLMGAPVAGLKIPAGLIVPGRSKLRIEGYWNKTGATSGANCVVTLGTANGLTDSQVGKQGIGAAATAVWRQFTELTFPSATAYTENSVATAVNGASGATTTPNGTTNINTAADMYMNWGSTTAVSGDGLQLVMVTVSLFQ